MALCLAGCGAASGGGDTLADGSYTASVTMSGGTGKAHIESPCAVTVSGGKATAEITWSSPNYDYMIVDGTTFYPVNTEGNSRFVIPVVLEREMEISADTVAMSTPHLIEYTVVFSILESGGGGVDLAAADGGVGGSEGEGDSSGFSESSDPSESSELSDPSESSDSSASEEALRPLEIPGLTYLGTDENDCAECFRIHRYSGGVSLISVYDGRRYLVVPEEGTLTGSAGSQGSEGSSTSGQFPTSGVEDVAAILYQPLKSIYLAASGSMCHFDSLGAIPSIVLSGIEKDGWYIEAAKDAMEEGRLEYGGKYSAPDYEKIIDRDVDLAIENTMILHTPKVLEKLESLGIPVFIDRSNYEENPLGRCEWIKVYGVLTGKEAEAEKVYNEQAALIRSLGSFEDSQKSVVVFSISTNHKVYVKKGNDYFAKMIEMAGGRYLSPDTPGDDGMGSQTSITMEAFYDYATGADMIIYNSTIEDAPQSIEELVSMDGLFADFKAVQDGNVWFTDKSMYQIADKTGTIIEELNEIISGKEEETALFHRLR